MLDLVSSSSEVADCSSHPPHLCLPNDVGEAMVACKVPVGTEATVACKVPVGTEATVACKVPVGTKATVACKVPVGTEATVACKVPVGTEATVVCKVPVGTEATVVCKVPVGTEATVVGKVPVGTEATSLSSLWRVPSRCSGPAEGRGDDHGAPRRGRCSAAPRLRALVRPQCLRRGQGEGEGAEREAWADIAGRLAGWGCG